MTEQLPFHKRLFIESFNRIGTDVTFGAVEIDQNTCDGCGYCIKPCPANVIEVVNKKARMVEDMPFCIACGDCVAICPHNSIEIKEFLKFHKHFYYLDRGSQEPPRRF
ncbi:MAG: indolepyruvate ferredoxin oxidoreductase subunit alpha [bacterium]